MRGWIIAAVAVFAVSATAADPLQEYLRLHGKPPVEYVLSKLADYRIVIVGEDHWNRDDPELITALVPELRRCGVLLAMEFFRTEDQEALDDLLSARLWDEEKATALMRSGDWPYVEYRDILRAAWEVNRAFPSSPLKIIALGPPRDFRARGIRYDEFMAEQLLPFVATHERQVLAYVGMHHAFTRYHQVERRNRGRATEFMNRFGNILWRRFGDNVFLIALHKPDWCGTESPTSRFCPPFRGRIDCAGSALQRPAGFDVLGSPIAEEKFPENSYYGFGHPLLRLIDYTDGYIWTRPIDQIVRVRVIAREEYDPRQDAAKWNSWLERFSNPHAQPAWSDLGSWRKECP